VAPRNLAHNKFQERASGAYRMLENLLAAGGDPAGGAYSAPQTLDLVQRGLAAPSPRIPPTLSVLWKSGAS